MRLCWFPPAESEVLSCWLEMPTSFLGTCQQEETGVGAVVREWGPRGPGQALRAAPRARVGPSLPSPSTVCPGGALPAFSARDVRSLNLASGLTSI